MIGLVYAGLAAYSMLTGMQNAEMIRENARLSQEVNDFNSDLALLDAYQAQQDGYSQEARYENVISQTIGSQRAAYAAGGVDVNFGTAAAVQSETRLRGELNKMDIINEANNRAIGYRNEARATRLQGFLNSSASEVSAAATQNAGIIKAAELGLSGYAKEGGFNNKASKIGSSKTGTSGYPNNVGASRDLNAALWED